MVSDTVTLVTSVSAVWLVTVITYEMGTPGRENGWSHESTESCSPYWIPRLPTDDSKPEQREVAVLRSCSKTLLSYWFALWVTG